MSNCRVISQSTWVNSPLLNKDIVSQQGNAAVNDNILLSLWKLEFSDKQVLMTCLLGNIIFDKLIKRARCDNKPKGERKIWGEKRKIERHFLAAQNVTQQFKLYRPSSLMGVKWYNAYHIQTNCVNLTWSDNKRTQSTTPHDPLPMMQAEYLSIWMFSLSTKGLWLWAGAGW